MMLDTIILFTITFLTKYLNLYNITCFQTIIRKYMIKRVGKIF